MPTSCGEDEQVDDGAGLALRQPRSGFALVALIACVALHSALACLQG